MAESVNTLRDKIKKQARAFEKHLKGKDVAQLDSEEEERLRKIDRSVQKLLKRAKEEDITNDQGDANSSKKKRELKEKSKDKKKGSKAGGNETEEDAAFAADSLF